MGTGQRLGSALEWAAGRLDSQSCKFLISTQTLLEGYFKAESIPVCRLIPTHSKVDLLTWGGDSRRQNSAARYALATMLFPQLPPSKPLGVARPTRDGSMAVTHTAQDFVYRGVLKGVVKHADIKVHAQFHNSEQGPFRHWIRRSALGKGREGDRQLDRPRTDRTQLLAIGIGLFFDG